jgi:3-methyladenine DNA glycosylase/8-oxoguanine DNA glycosylase
MTKNEFALELRTAESALSRRDPLLRGLIRRHGPCALEPRWTRTPYQSLVQAVVYQQLSGKAASTIFERFLALFPGERPVAAKGRLHPRHRRTGDRRRRTHAKGRTGQAR